MKPTIKTGDEFRICTDPYPGGPRYARMKITEIEPLKDEDRLRIKAEWNGGRGGSPELKVKGTIPAWATLDQIEDLLDVEEA